MINQTFNITGYQCTTIYQSADPRLFAAIIALLLVYLTVITICEIKLREKYAKFFKRKLSELPTANAETK